MADVGDRIAVVSKGVPRSGVVTAVSGAMLTVRWDTGSETSLVPGPGVVSVVRTRRRATTPRSRTASRKVAPGKKSAAKKSAAKKAAPGKKSGAKKAAAGKKSAAKRTSSSRATAKRKR
jgi:hypothetical protein